MLPAVPSPRSNINMNNLLLDCRPVRGPTEMHGYKDAEWAMCPIMRWSMGDGNLMVAGGTVGYKAGLLPTLAMLFTEAMYMEAAAMGCRYLYW
jgi:hypothetical protein